MTKRFLFATSAIAFLIPNIASATAPDIKFFAKEKWTVERVREKTPEQAAMCAVSTQLNNGYIVQIAGTAKGFTNFNIDFRQSSFQKNLKYEVKYTVPGYFEGTLPTKAFKDNLLVTDLRRYGNAREDIPTAGTIDLHIRDNSFRLYMTGLAAKMKDYDDCVTGDDVVNAKLTQESPVAAPSENTFVEAKPSEEQTISDLGETETTEDLNMIAARNETVEKTTNLAPPPPVHNLQPAAKEKAPVQKEAIAAPVKLETSTEQTTPDAPPPTEQTKVKQTEIAPVIDNQVTEDKRAMVAPAATTGPKTTISRTSAKPYYIQKLGDKLDRLRGKRPDVAGKSATQEHAAYKSPGAVIHVKKHTPVAVDLTKEQIDMKPMAAENVDVVATVTVGDPLPTDALEKTIPQGPAYTEESCQRQVENALSNIQPAAGQPTQATEDFLHMRQKVSDLEGRVQTLLRENKVLDEELKTTLKDAAKERMSVSSDNWNLEKATMRFNEAERQTMRLGRQLQTQRAQCQNEKTQLENLLFDPKLTSQQQLATLASMETELDKAKADLYRQQRQYEERIKLLEQKLSVE